MVSGISVSVFLAAIALGSQILSFAGIVTVSIEATLAMLITLQLAILTFLLSERRALDRLEKHESQGILRGEVLPDQVQLYQRICAVLQSRLSDGDPSYIWISAVHGGHGVRVTEVGSAKREFTKLERLLDRAAELRGGRQWSIRTLYNVTNLERLGVVESYLARIDTAERVEIRAFCSRDPIPMIAPMLIGPDHCFLGREDDRYYRAKDGVYLRSRELADWCAEYYESIWNDRRTFVIRTPQGFSADGLDELRQAVLQMNSDTEAMPEHRDYVEGNE
jgi:hypothetical protein